MSNILDENLTRIISETNGIFLADTLELASNSMLFRNHPRELQLINQFRDLLAQFTQSKIDDKTDIDSLLQHPVSDSLTKFFKNFPLKFQEEHTHLTGSLTPNFLFPRIKKLITGPHKKIYLEKIANTFGTTKIESPADIANLITLKEGDTFNDYLQILLMGKLILIDKKAYSEAARHIADEMYHQYNVGQIRLKFTLSRASSLATEIIPNHHQLSAEDVVLGLYEGLQSFKNEHPDFNFILSPCFRKEEHFFDSKNFSNKEECFFNQVNSILNLLEKYPYLRDCLTDVDTVGNEKDLYRKGHFQKLRNGLRKLQFSGIQIRSHHGEIWKTLQRGVQAVDNAMNIWHINTLEHGLALGINPNYYFQMLFEKVMYINNQGKTLPQDSPEYFEILDMEWTDRDKIRDKLIQGKKLQQSEILTFIKTKFHTAREVEHYQHDILNRMIHKKVTLTSLPSSNKKLSSCLSDYKDHPFSWWEKKGIKLGVGTDNYITLKTNFIKEMLILLYSDPFNLKITKLLMVVTGETRRPFLGQLLWKMRG